jgi:hypothetical protein
MSVDLAQAQLLKQWFAPEGEGEVDAAARQSMSGDIREVSQLLAELWFSADYAWVQWSDDDVRTVLLQWLPDGSAEETQFTQYAVAGELEDFLGWLKPRIVEWQKAEAQATEKGGIENPDYARDPIPGTRYYRWAAEREEYLYADNPAEPYVPGDAGWLTMDERIRAQDKTQPHYDPGTDRWRQHLGGEEYSYQNRQSGHWERYHSDPVGWLPYDQPSDTWLYRDEWRAYHEIAAPGAPVPGALSQVIPVHQISGWEHLQGQPWARDWYARPGAEGYDYLHSPGAVPAENTPGWSHIPPAPPAEAAHHETTASPAPSGASSGTEGQASIPDQYMQAALGWAVEQYQQQHGEPPSAAEIVRAMEEAFQSPENRPS